MIGITDIGTYIPEGRISNLARKEKFRSNDEFIFHKVGIANVAIKDPGEETSDMAVKAFHKLEHKRNIDKSLIQVVILITQNPDSNIPHSSATIHDRLNLHESCACFDVSLGCSGYVYGLSIAKSFMEDNGFSRGLLFTSDPYSKIIDPEDKNTSMLFGDAATVTYLTNNPKYTPGKFTFGTLGKDSEMLVCEDGKLKMNSRGIFNFAARYVPPDFNIILEKNHCDKENIDKFIFHQGSKYIIDTLIKRMGLDSEKVVFDATEYGNTVSSSIPIILEKEMNRKSNKCIYICGFGVGLSWSSNILYRTD